MDDKNKPPQFAKPKVKPEPVVSVAPAPAVRFAKEKPRPLVDWNAVDREDPLALATLAGEVRRWNCPDCPGIIREDGIACHHNECVYWETHPTETPF